MSATIRRVLASLDAADARPFRGVVGHIVLFVLFAALAVAMTWPLGSHLGTHVLAGKWSYDAWLNAFVLDQNVHALTSSDGALLDTGMFWPHERVLMYSEHLLGETAVALLLRPFGEHPLLWHNVNLLLSLALSGWFGALLGAEIARSRVAGLFAGFAMTVCPVVFYEMDRVQLVAFQWTALSLWLLVRWDGERRRSLAWGAGAAFAAQWLWCLYYGAMLSVLIAAIALWRVVTREWQRSPREHAFLGLAFAGAMLPVLPLLALYRRVHDAIGLERPLDHVQRWGAQTGSYFCSEKSELSGFLQACPKIGNKATMYPGIVVLACLCVATGVLLWRAARRLWDGARPDLAALALALVVVIFARYERSLSFLLLLPLGFAVLRKPSTERGYGGWLLLAGFAVLLSFGPSVTWFGEGDRFSGPYQVLYEVFPGFKSIRYAGRFGLFAGIALAVLAARVLGTPRGPSRFALVGLAFGLASADYWPAPHEVEAVPLPGANETAAFLAAAAPGPVLELPMKGQQPGGKEAHELAAVLRAMRHRHPVVNGHSGFDPPFYTIVQAETRRCPSARCLALLRTMGVRWLVFRLGLFPGGERDRVSSALAQPHDGLVARGAFGDDRVYELLPAEATPPETVAGLVPLAVASVTSSRGKSPGLAADGNVRTRWTTERNQERGDWLEVDLGVVRNVAAIRLHHEDALDFPRGLEISVAIDRETRTTIREAPNLFGWPELVRGVRPYDLDLVLPATRARWLRLRLTEGAAKWWSVSELTVYGQ